MNVYGVLARPEFERLREWANISPVHKEMLLDFIDGVTYEDGEAFAAGFDVGYAEAKAIYESED
jgi:hypothetical protein